MMSNVIFQLRRIFDDRFIENTTDVICEPDEDMKRTVIKGNIDDDNILICRLDHGNRKNVIDMFPYFRGDSREHGLKGMKRICDYVVFVDKNDILYILLLELKKGKNSPQEQLDVSEPFIEFILSRAKILNYLDVRFKVRKIGITDVVDRRTTEERGEVVYDDNSYVKLYQNKNLYLQRLLH